MLKAWAGSGPGGLKYNWELVSDTGQIMAKSEDFPNEATARNAIEWLKQNAQACPVDFVQPPPQRGVGIA
jgi:uncharacterized protein YegP (UPF0339 family)